MTSSPPPSVPADLAAAFARRVAERDVVRPPEPPSLTPEAIAGRVNAWLEATHEVWDRRNREGLTPMLLLLLAQPDVPTAALAAAAGLGPRMTARHLLRLEALGLTEWFYRARTRYHRLTRAGEDALLPVVQGGAA